MRLKFALLGLLVATPAALAQTAPTDIQFKSYTGLHKAAYENDVQAVAKLVGQGADLNARDSFGRTPAHVAAFASNDEVLNALGKVGADMNALENGIYDVVTIAAVTNDPELMSLAIELGNRADLTTSVYDGTALIAAAHLGHHEVVRRLIKAGAPLDHVNNLHWTALIEAVVLGDGGSNHTATVKALVDAGANTSLTDASGVTALAHAKQRGYTEMVELIKNAKN